jgi:uncharacterized membrane protein YqjE
MSLQQDHLLDRLKKLPNEIRLLIEKKIELYMIEFVEKFSNGFSKLLASIVSFLVFLLGITFALFAAAFFIGELLDSYALGFSAVAVLILIVGLVVYLLSPELIESGVKNRIIRVFLDDYQSSTKKSTSPFSSEPPSATTINSANQQSGSQEKSVSSNPKNGQRITNEPKNGIVDYELNTDSETESSAHTIKNININ